MVQSIHSGWKQPVAYYFAKDSIKSKDLSYLIREIIEQLQIIGIIVACTVYEQRSRSHEQGSPKIIEKGKQL
jgi:hypothetical protein